MWLLHPLFYGAYRLLLMQPSVTISKMQIKKKINPANVIGEFVYINTLFSFFLLLSAVFHSLSF
jgi:hypothetical protein